MAIGIIRWDKERGGRLYEGHTLGREDDDYATLHFSGAPDEAESLERDLIEWATRRGYKLCEGTLRERYSDRVSVVGVIANDDGTPRAVRRRSRHDGELVWDLPETGT